MKVPRSGKVLNNEYIRFDKRVHFYGYNLSVSGPFWGLVRTGATGASTPSEIWQRVRRTRPDSSGLVLMRFF